MGKNNYHRTLFCSTTIFKVFDTFYKIMRQIVIEYYERYLKHIFFAFISSLFHSMDLCISMVIIYKRMIIEYFLCLKTTFLVSDKVLKVRKLTEYKCNEKYCESRFFWVLFHLMHVCNSEE